MDSNSPQTTRTYMSAPSADGISDEEQKLFYDRLAQTGQLIDVTPGTDLSKLPPSITHVRWPDGRVERIGFA